MEFSDIESSPAQNPNEPDETGRDPDYLRFLLAAIVESCEDAIVSKDLNGTITTWNQAATTMFGYTADEMIGQSILKIIPEQLHAEETEILRKLRAGERIDHYETTRKRKDGEAVEVSLHHLTY